MEKTRKLYDSSKNTQTKDHVSRKYYNLKKGKQGKKTMSAFMVKSR